MKLTASPVSNEPLPTVTVTVHRWWWFDVEKRFVRVKRGANALSTHLAWIRCDDSGAFTVASEGERAVINRCLAFHKQYHGNESV